MLTADYARTATELARHRVVQRDDIYATESMIRERADSGWFTLRLMPFSTNRERAEYVQRLLLANGYECKLLVASADYGLDISWYLKDESP